MAKILVEKDESVADLIERILEDENEETTLVIPKKSHLLDSKSNFRLIAREGKTLGKNIIVESVDQDALEAAGAAGLQVVHPLFGERAVENLAGKAPRKGRGKVVKLKVPAEEIDEALEEPETEANRHGEVIKNGDDETMSAEDERYDTLEESRVGSRFAIFATIGGIVLLGLLVLFAVNTWFARANVIINFKKTPWNFENTVVALTSVRDIDPARNTIPGQLFEEEKSLTQAFAANGESIAASKATGVITVVNNYSAEPQPLVATTRFEAPDGRIYRLDTDIVVPGAKVEDGKVTQSSIKAAVTADKGGDAYNTGRIDKLNIPGFRGTAKYSGFWGVLENGAAGGGSGSRKVATDTDVANARQKVEETMQSAFQTTFLSSIPADIKVLEKAAAVDLGRVVAQRTADQNGNFTMTGAAVFRAFGFREKDLVTLLTARANGEGGGKKIENLAINYSNATPNFDAKQLAFSVTANGNLAPDFNTEEFAGKLAGLEKDQAKVVISELPELVDAKVTVWPSWLSNLPKKPSRVRISVQ